MTIIINGSTGIDTVQDAKISPAKLTTNGSGGFTLPTSAGNAVVADSSGRVTMPYQPAFHAFPNSSYDINTTGAVIPFNNTVLNIGSHYNTSTQRFTAPIAGVYSFSASFWATPGNFGNMAICRNGDNSAMGSKGRTGGVTGQYIFCTLNSTIYLNANDYVDCRCVDGTQVVHVNNGFNNFTGYLIG